MPKRGYKFSNIESVLTRMINSDPYPTSPMLSDLKKELNKFFDEAECIDIIFTKNTDKLFFGMCVMPILNGEEVLDIVIGSNKIKVQKYYLEIDSKILNIGLNTKELAAVLLHEIGHMVIDDQPIKQVRESIDKYLTDNDDIVKLKDSAQFNQILSFAIKDTMRKFTSMMFKDNDELVADAFVVSCGYGEYLASAQGKIISNINGLTKSVKAPKIFILDWVFRLYTNIKFSRMPAIMTLKKSISYTGSSLEKNEVRKVIDALNKIDVDLVEESTILLEAFNKKNSFAARLKTNGLRSIEDDYYEYKVRVKNANTEDEAMYALRQINSRLTILDDYLSSNDLEQSEYDRWYKVLEKYRELREDLAAKKVYNKKNYGLWYDYGQLDSENKMY